MKAMVAHKSSFLGLCYLFQAKVTNNYISSQLKTGIYHCRVTVPEMTNIDISRLLKVTKNGVLIEYLLTKQNNDLQLTRPPLTLFLNTTF